MKHYVAFILLLALSPIATAQTVTVYMTRNKTFDKNLTTYSASFDTKKQGALSKVLWRSPGGTVCDIFITYPQLKGTFTCQSPDNYKAQIEFDCTANTSLEKSAYLFFGQVGYASEVSNFDLWCD